MDTSSIRLTIEGFEPDQRYPDLLITIGRRILSKEITVDEGRALTTKVDEAYTAVLNGVIYR